MIDHTPRINGVVKNAVKEAALGEPAGYVVSFGYWPILDPQTGQNLGTGPAWVVVVTMKSPIVGAADLDAVFAIPGAVPPDDQFQAIARGLVANCRAQAAQKTQMPMKGQSLEGLVK